MNDAAKNVVDELLGDLDDRSGFDTGLVDPRAMDEWRERWEAMVSRALSASRAEGYAAAREQAWQVAERCRKERETLATNEFAPTRPRDAQAALNGKESEALRIRDAIRAMQDGMEKQTCVACGCAEHDGRACLNVREFPGFRLRECRCVGWQRP